MIDLSKKEYLKKTQIFSDLDVEEIDELALLVLNRKLKKNTVIFHENDPASSFYLLKKGRIKIIKISKDGDEQILAILGPGQIFGDVPAFDGGPYPATAVTMADSEIFFIRCDEFHDFLRGHPDIALKIIKVLGQRLRQAVELVRDLSFKQAPHRLAGLILKMAKREGEKTDRGILVDLSMSRQEISDVVGTSRETVTRELKKMERAGIIEIDRRQVTVTDLERLSAWAR